MRPNINNNTVININHIQLLQYYYFDWNNGVRDLSVSEEELLK